MAIKELRSWSSLGLKEAKDAMDRAYAELGRQQAPWPSSRPGSYQP